MLMYMAPKVVLGPFCCELPAVSLILAHITLPEQALAGGGAAEEPQRHAGVHDPQQSCCQCLIRHPLRCQNRHWPEEGRLTSRSGTPVYMAPEVML